MPRATQLVLNGPLCTAPAECVQMHFTLSVSAWDLGFTKVCLLLRGGRCLLRRGLLEVTFIASRLLQSSTKLQLLSANQSQACMRKHKNL